jgi:hypothetical protein
MFKLHLHLWRTNARFSPCGWTQNISNGQQTERKIKLSSDYMKGPTCEPSVNVFSFAARRRLDFRSAPACVVCTTHSLPIFISLVYPTFIPLRSLSFRVSCVLVLFILPSLRTSFTTFSLSTYLFLTVSTVPLFSARMDLTTKSYVPLTFKYISIATPRL